MQYSYLTGQIKKIVLQTPAIIVTDHLIKILKNPVTFQYTIIEL